MSTNISDQEIVKLTEKYGTPIYIYQKEEFDNAYRSLKKCLHDRFDIFYSVKANPNLKVIKNFVDLGAGLEVSSLSELHFAQKLEVNPSKVIFVGPGKTRKEIEEAIKYEIFSIVVESEQELDLVNQLAEKFNKKVNVSIRVNPNLTGKGSELVMSGKSSQFGIDEDIILAKKTNWLNQYTNLRIMGIHTYMGTGVTDSNIFIENTKYIIEMAYRISRQFNLKLEMIDVGGGLLPNIYENQEILDLEDIYVKMEKVIEDIPKLFNADIRLILESGRYLTACAGIYVTKVLYTKHSKGKDYVIVDGGINNNIAASGGIRKQTHSNFYVHTISSTGQSEGIKRQQVCGCLCTPADVLLEDALLPVLSPDDLIVIKGSGAYGLTASPLYFLSHDIPPEVWIERDGEINKVELVRKRLSTELFLIGQ
ncbi:Diaminopimelate decarboxylase (plasmid) [Geobacillus thermodenitrificans]|uniref:diaminopimelate decarboxylase n=1 Tax=Geobacillus thermodenitrificans TaxID=33940 RepID=UPI000A290CA9|nr:diaminopimelate decarboxylase [Geobacillus thermodenitrificans]ARP44566.1 Diaminopimelate decarboxylase [Geobacillus thermodenitrificans]